VLHKNGVTVEREEGTVAGPSPSGCQQASRWFQMPFAVPRGTFGYKEARRGQRRAFHFGRVGVPEWYGARVGVNASTSGCAPFDGKHGWRRCVPLLQTRIQGHCSVVSG
jgi:hypothetical protein